MLVYFSRQASAAPPAPPQATSVEMDDAHPARGAGRVVHVTDGHQAAAIRGGALVQQRRLNIPLPHIVERHI